jgi:uncharacterized protein YgiM (DUF1202 family)
MRGARRHAGGVLLALALAGAGPAQSADTRYVVDQLVIKVTAAADGSGEPVATLKSGDRIELLEEQEEHARVRLASGEEGWVKASDLTAEPPVRRQLEARTQELGELKQKVALLQTQLAQARDASRPAPAAPPAPAPLTAGPTPLRTTSAANPGVDGGAESGVRDRPLFSSVGSGLPRPGWGWVAGVAVASLLAGFAIGWRVLDRRIRSKYGGLRIY